jgi:hemin uptake protein HemP
MQKSGRRDQKRVKGRPSPFAPILGQTFWSFAQLPQFWKKCAPAPRKTRLRSDLTLPQRLPQIEPPCLYQGTEKVIIENNLCLWAHQKTVIGKFV